MLQMQYILLEAFSLTQKSRKHVAQLTQICYNPIFISKIGGIPIHSLLNNVYFVTQYVFHHIVF